MSNTENDTDRPTDQQVRHMAPRLERPRMTAATLTPTTHDRMVARLAQDLAALEANRPGWWRPIRRARWAVLVAAGAELLEVNR